jgi:hypothetical protein
MIRYILTVGILGVLTLEVVRPEWAMTSRFLAVSVNLLWIWDTKA